MRLLIAFAFWVGICGVVLGLSSCNITGKPGAQAQEAQPAMIRGIFCDTIAQAEMLMQLAEKGGEPQANIDKVNVTFKDPTACGRSSVAAVLGQKVGGVYHLGEGKAVQIFEVTVLAVEVNGQFQKLNKPEAGYTFMYVPDDGA